MSRDRGLVAYAVVARSGRDSSAERVAFRATMNPAIRSIEPKRTSVENALAPRASAAVTSRRVPPVHSNLIPQARFSHGVSSYGGIN